MKLNVDFSLLHSAVSKMGAVEITFDISQDNTPLDPIDTQLGEGLEVDLQDINFETGLASYQGRQVLLYIKDHNTRVSTALTDGSKGNKYHVADCSKLEEMRAKGRYDRYVVTNKLDGQFSITGHEKYTTETIEGITDLKLCQFCLGHLNYKGFKNIKDPAKRKKFVLSFELVDFFDTYSSYFKFMPSGIADAKSQGYSKDWAQVSNNIKLTHNYICQQCNLNLSQYKRLLHSHHINGVKHDNSTHNLTPLCADCHRKQPNHQHMFISHKDTKIINHLRQEQRLVVKDNWQDIYKFSDPAMHGIIDMLGKSYLPLPDIAYQITNTHTGEIADLELAWPIKKTGIAVDKQSAILAHKQGWKVYSMRHSLSKFNELTAKLRGSF